MYSELSEHLNCVFMGINSPVILRFEAVTESGGMRVEEFHDACPFISLHGDVAEAKQQFLIGLEGLAEYLSLLERHRMIRCDGCWGKPRWFQVEIRQPAYRVTLYGEGDSYRFSYMLMNSDFDTDPLIDGLQMSYARLRQVYEAFFDTKI